MALEKAEVSKVIFGIFSGKEIEDLSVVQVKTSLCFNALDHPLQDGLYDLVMGPSRALMNETCLTCKHNVQNCCGHFGHINLPLPVVNPLFHKEVFTLLKISCNYCYKLVIPPRIQNLFIHQMELLDRGKITEAEELETLILCDTKECNPNEEIGLSLKAKLGDFIKGPAEPVQSTRTIESLRVKFVRTFTKQITIPNTCPACKKPVRRFVCFQNKIIAPVSKVEVAEKFKDSGRKGASGRSETTFITPRESREMLRKIWAQNKYLIEKLMPILKSVSTNTENPTDLFYMEVVLVTPPRTRPVNVLKGQIIENVHTTAYKNIINDCVVIKSLVKAINEDSFDRLTPECKIYVEATRGSTPLEKFHECWLQLQNDVNILLDSNMGSVWKSGGLIGLKQVMEKKDGVLRMHMMGKRVNFAARTVITPDPNLNIHEIGVPEHFAKKLTYPTKVNPYNVEELRQMVRNGPEAYPGATAVENENGSLIKLFGGEENRKRREGVAKMLLKGIEGNEPSTAWGTKMVHRHLLSGDILLMNRQPTLHRPSIMAHRAKILKGERTLRLHYSNCKAYNADFDGDEMNVHFPQTELSRSEGYNLVSVIDHYLVPKDGTPLGGLIQDHIVSMTRLTLRNQFFEREDYHQLVCQGLSHKLGSIVLLPPCILKPKRLWSGKQIISTILINSVPKNKELITFNGTAKISFKCWEKETPREWKCGGRLTNPNEMSESEVIVVKGHLLSGVLDKQHFGATPYGLIHCLYELYGGECSSRFLDSIGKVATVFLQLHGFTLGVKDILVEMKANKSRRKVIEELRKCGNDTARKALNLDEVPFDLDQRLEKQYFQDPVKFKAKLDQEYKKCLDSFTNDINKICLPRGLICHFPDNNLQLMVTSGAKGSTVNTMQISCLLGQIELEGRRPPLMISGKSLPSYKPFETRPRAGGYIDNSFLNGITPQEFFFHCMAGREGLIDTAVKTSRSGYLQRCLIKHLESISVCYDGTVRDHDGTVIQFTYGEDGLEVQKSKFFTLSHMDFLYNNSDTIADKSMIKSLKKGSDYHQIKTYREHLNSFNAFTQKRVLSPFTVFTGTIKGDINGKHFKRFNKATGRSRAYTKMLNRWNSMSTNDKENYNQNRRPDPLLAKYDKSYDFGVITEKLDSLIEEYIESRFHVTETKQKKKLRNMMEAKYMLSLCQPGEAVGLLAAQSIGEPSTQMTLNTFHFAGRGEMNVTLGIPRLREILMTASKLIKTPYVEVPLKKKKSEKKIIKYANKLKKIFQRVTLADVLDKITVDEELVLDPVNLFTYTVRFHLLPHSCYKHQLSVSPKDVLAYIENPFLISLRKEIKKMTRRHGDIVHELTEKKHVTNEEETKEGDDVDESDKAGAAPQKIQRLGEDHESSDEDEELDDDDATKVKLRSRHQENQEYDEPEESEKEDSESEEEESSKLDAEIPDEEPPKFLTKEELCSVDKRKEFVVKTFPFIKSYHFDVAKEEWCEMVIGIPLSTSKIDFSTVLRVLCERSVIHEIPNVKRAIVYQKPSGEYSLKTEGVNFIEMFGFNEMVDIRKLYSNDIHEVVKVFGIEAGVRVIVKELNEVFGVYGITVDPRHLLLVADYMTNQGYYSPFNRTGLTDCSSPLQQMSFESSTAFLKRSLLRGQEDAMDSPSARIMAGRFCGVGTGCFDVLTLPTI